MKEEEEEKMHMSNHLPMHMTVIITIFVINDASRQKKERFKRILATIVILITRFTVIKSIKSTVSLSLEWY